MYGLKGLILFFVIALFSFSVAGHNLKGTVTDKDGNPIAYATIYIKELTIGTTTNEEGKFEINIQPGIYEIVFRCLGYKPKTENITISKEEENISVVLEIQILEINEVIISGKDEDPAYAIMRKVIGLSYVHLNQVSSYTAEFYIRGTVKFQSIPGIIRNQLRKKNINIRSGDVLVNETVSEISFQAPTRYVQHIKSINSTFPEVVDFSVGDFLGASLYQDNIEVLITPLNKNAFSYYSFTYMGYEKEDRYLIDKIKVTPKIKSKQLFEGYIYIIEDLWCLSRADLSFETPFGRVSFQLVFDEVRPGVWLPVNHNYLFSGGLLGVRANARFAASIKYNKIKVNEDVLGLAGLSTKQLSESEKKLNGLKKEIASGNKVIRKRASKIDELLNKPNLKNFEANKLSRLMGKQDNDLKPDSLKSLRINDAVKVTTEKGADKKDTAYWSSIRPIPLSLEEMESFRQRDSLKSFSRNDRFHRRNGGYLEPLFLGSKLNFRDSSWQGKYNGLFTIKAINFNAVDGWNISQGLLFTRIYRPGVSLSLSPNIIYAINRKALLGTGNMQYKYAPMSRGDFQLGFGRNTIDFNGPADGINPFINTVASLFFKENYARYYESRYVDLVNSIDIANGVNITGGIKWQKAVRLENTTNFSFINKSMYAINVPFNREISESSVRDQLSTTIRLKIQYTPQFYYRIRNGVKIMAHSNYPSFYLEYRKGIRKLFSSTADFDFIGAGFIFGKELTSTSSIAYEFHSGWFPNSTEIHFSDFVHAPVQKSPVLLKEYRHAFYLPGYYELNTADKYLRAHFSYKTPYLALKYLPFLSNTLWREMIWTSYFSSPQNRNYLEIGYTLLEVLLSANVGVFSGFTDGKFKGWGINISFRWTD